jgi:hypothetical protein
MAQYATGEMACYEQEDIWHSILKHASDWMYKSLQLYVLGDVKDPTDLHL